LKKEQTPEKPGRVVGVKFVYDGDSILLENGQKVRYIGIDAPELNDSGAEDDECLAWEAKVRNMELLGQGEVRIVKDPGANKDKYGRLLRYIYVGDELINKTLVREGLAEPFFCQPGWENCPVTRDKDKKEIILNSYEYARDNNLGIFSSSCIFDQDKKVAQKDSLGEQKVKGEKVEEKSEEEKEEKNEGEDKMNIHLLGGGDPNPEPESPSESDSREGENNSQEEEETEESSKENDSSDNGDEPQDSDEQEDQKKKSEPDPPSVELTQAPPQLTSSTQATFTAQIRNASTTRYKLDGDKATTATSTMEFKDLKDGKHEFTAVATNTLGVTSTSFNWEVDTTIEDPVITNLPYHKNKYWINKNNIKIQGEKSPDITEISLAPVGSSTSTAVSFGTNSERENWHIPFDFNFPCIDLNYSQNFMDLLQTKMSCLSQKKDFNNPEQYQDIYTRKIQITARDRAGNIATSSYDFSIDSLPPRIGPQEKMARKHSSANNQVYFSFVFIDEIIDIMVSSQGSDISLFPDSGVKETKWQYQNASSSEWQKVEPNHHFVTQTSANDFGKLQSNFYGFHLGYNKDYYFRTIIEDRAGNTATHTQKKKIETGKPYPVISEIYPNASTTESGGEWIELYNPSDKDVSLKGHSLDTPTYDNDVEFTATSTISSHGYFLIGDDDWTPDDRDWPEPDHKETITLKNSGGVITLKDEEGEEVDSAEYKRLSPLESMERKARFDSDREKMKEGGEHHEQGNGWDTDDQRDDFIKKHSPEPQNSSSTPEKWSF